MVASATSGGILDKAIEAEDRRHGDFLRLVELFSFFSYFLSSEKHSQNLVITFIALKKPAKLCDHVVFSISCKNDGNRNMLKVILNCRLRQRHTLPLLLLCGMRISMSRLMMMYT